MKMIFFLSNPYNYIAFVLFIMNIAQGYVPLLSYIL